jgi:hypothetical protein
VPRVYTNPDYVFTAHNGENLALVCWVQGDLWHSTYSGRTDVIWDLVIDRDQSNGAGYISQADAVGYLNDADTHGYTNNYCRQPGLGGLGCG